MLMKQCYFYTFCSSHYFQKGKMKTLKLGKGNRPLRRHMTLLIPDPFASDRSPRKSNGVKTRRDESHRRPVSSPDCPHPDVLL